MATNPTLLLVPIAENGTKNTLPENQATPGNGLMSQSTGFPAECSLPLGAGGIAPDRADFNGAFNLLSGVAFYVQKGWRFQFSATQAYYAGCIVIDTTDGNAYQAIADVSAGGSVPSLDTTNWILYAKQSATEQQPFIPAFNKRDVVTVSGTYTAPVTGWYRIVVKGGGGGGGTASSGQNTYFGGYGGGEGGTTIGWEHLDAGDTVSVVIGAGGAANGGAGGDSTVTANGNTYTGGKGNYGYGGSGTIPGAPGGAGATRPTTVSYLTTAGGNGGGAGGGIGSGIDGTNGGGGGGGGVSVAGVIGNGGKGGAGFAWFEYFDPTL